MRLVYDFFFVKIFFIHINCGDDNKIIKILLILLEIVTVVMAIVAVVIILLELG